MTQLLTKNYYNRQENESHVQNGRRHDVDFQHHCLSFCIVAALKLTADHNIEHSIQQNKQIFLGDNCYLQSNILENIHA